MASTIGTSFNDAEIEPVISAVQQEQSFVPLCGVKVAIVDDSRSILRSAIPVLVTATNDNTALMHVDPSKDFTPMQIIDAIVSSGTTWVPPSPSTFPWYILEFRPSDMVEPRTTHLHSHFIPFHPV
jgi:hypothetical protein